MLTVAIIISFVRKLNAVERTDDCNDKYFKVQ